MRKATLKFWPRHFLVSLCLSSSAIVGLEFIGQVALAQTPNTVETRTNLDQIKTQLIGQWEYFSEDQDPIRFILTPNGELFMLDPLWGEAIRFTWTLAITDQQPTITANVGSVQLNGTLSSATVMSLRLVDLLNNGQTPQEITTNAQKLSSDPILPEDSVVIDAADYYQRQAIHARQWSARLRVSRINRAQQIYFLEHQQLADAQTILSPSLGSSEYYTYQISLSDDGQIATILALPQQTGLIGYFGSVIVTSSDNTNSASTIATICESIEPTLQPPLSIPSFTGSDAHLPPCPGGYIYPSARPVDLSNRRAVRILENRVSINIGYINRTQQSILLERDKFEDNIQAFARGLAVDLQNDKYYDYQIVLSEDGLTATILAIPKYNSLRAFIGRARLYTDEANQISTSRILQCESIEATRQVPELPPGNQEELTCPRGYVVSG